jgi:hypothetical protein
MPVSFFIKDPLSGKRTRVNPDGALYTIDEGVPIFGAPVTQLPFRDYFRNSAGSFDMRVAASPASPVEFQIMANSDPNVERYITSLAFVIADQNATLNQFGNIGVLPNGCDIEFNNPAAPNGIVSLSLTGLQTNYDFVSLAQGEPAFGDGTTAFRAANVSGNSEAYIPILNLKKAFGYTYGIRLQASSDDAFTIRINDNTSGVDEFTCIANGFDRINTGQN